MCGRYTYKLTWAEIVALYRLTLPEEPPERLKPSYNVALTDVMPIIRPAGNRGPLRPCPVRAFLFSASAKSLCPRTGLATLSAHARASRCSGRGWRSVSNVALTPSAAA
jgi:putative SOS response-associated peptidase YedK